MYGSLSITYASTRLKTTFFDLNQQAKLPEKIRGCTQKNRILVFAKKKKTSMQNKNSCAKDISISMSEKFGLVHVSILCHQNYFPSETGGSGSNFSFRKYEYTTIQRLNLNTNGWERNDRTSIFSDTDFDYLWQLKKTAKKLVEIDSRKLGKPAFFTTWNAAHHILLTLFGARGAQAGEVISEDNFW